MTLIKKSRLLLPATAILVVIVLIATILIYKKDAVKDVILLQGNAYCSEEFLEQARIATPSSEEHVKKYFDCKPILAYLKDSVSDAEIGTLVDNFKKLDGVYKVKYVSKQEALKIYKEVNKNEPLLLEYVTEEILPASIEVYVSEPSLKMKVIEFANSSTLTERIVK